jgi:phage shock protein A
MNLLARIAELLAFDLPLTVTPAEDVEMETQRSLDDLKGSLADARQYTAAIIAVERLVAREMQQNEVRTQRWQHRAETALANGQTGSARRAATREKSYAEAVRRLREEHAVAQAARERACKSLRFLEASLEAIRRRRRVLLAWHQAEQTGRTIAPAEDVELLRAEFQRRRQELHQLEQQLFD